jgi:hypothetical protein
MGDEPYAALLPWAVFAIVDRTQGDPAWAGIGALITALALLAASSRTDGRRNVNVIMVGAVVWFAGIATAGLLDRTNSGILARDGRVLSAVGFVVIALGSLAFKPAVEYYTRPHVRSSQWDDPAFRRVNVLITLIWAATFAGIALAHVVASAIATPEAFTVFNWVVPMALVVIAAHRSRVCWDDFNDDEMFDPDPMRDLAIDWETPISDTER